jgi:hypothetical protein
MRRRSMRRVTCHSRLGQGEGLDGKIAQRRRPFRRSYPKIDLDYTRFKFPVLAYKFPVPLQKFPVPLSREFRSKSAKSLDE